MAVPRIYADFHNADAHGRLRLTCAGTVEDLSHQGIQLRKGMKLLLYMDDADSQGRPDDLQAMGSVEFSDEENCWVAVINWSEVRHASDSSCMISDKKLSGS